MNSHIKREINGALRNLGNGVRLLLFRKISTSQFYVSHDQVLALGIVLAGTFFIGSFILSLPAPEFSFYGITTLATHLLFIALSIFIITKLVGNETLILPLFVVLLSIWPFLNLTWMIIGHSSFLSRWDWYGENKYLYILFNIWVAAVVVSAISQSVDAKWNARVVILVTYIIALGAPVNYLSLGSFWIKSYDFMEDHARYKAVNEEDTYYKQFKLIENARRELLPQRAGISDIYFVGFAAYADQDVFMQEVLYAQGVLDSKYDTAGRSIALINNLKTMEFTALATVSNLTLILEHIGTLIDPDEDLLFLYLTSHGSTNSQLSVELEPLTLNPIGPADLKTALDKSGIKYRVLLVSACYSGGFVEPLTDDYTIIFTASAKDKQSFGCSHQNDFTYFGKAVFKEQMENNFDLVDAFEKAAASIGRRENAEKLEHSEPQLYIGKKIREKLNVITEDIQKYNRARKSVYN